MPIEMRRELKIYPKDRVDFELHDGRIIVVPRRYTVRSASGAVPQSEFHYVEGETERMVKDERVEEFLERFNRL